MKYHIIINSIKTVNELKEAWTKEDYVLLLEKFGLEDTGDSNMSELSELLAMAVSDYEPEEAAAIVLDYKLSQQLNENQIEQISHEMLQDKISEEYADISLHHQLFNINQLLYKAYNGTFPNAKATIVEFEISPNKEVTRENVLKAFNTALASSNVIKRLFAKELAGKDKFSEAESIIWDLSPNVSNGYTLTTSEYWMSRDEFQDAEFDATVVEFEDEED
ncbi:MAG: hypothetical protein NWP87_01270 [Winogradskyella sp.]|nr:hypothetical protein [Winogradskyella sp.]